MNNNKGQALIEFAIILPVFLLLIFSVIDFGRVIYEKNMMENSLSTASELYVAGKEIDEIKRVINKEKLNKLDISIISKDEYTTIRLTQSLKPITPGITKLNLDVFKLSTIRVVYNEQ